MPHIDLPQGLAGIVGQFAFRPETAQPLQQLAETLLRGPSTLAAGDREALAAYVSSLNKCAFCRASHSAVAHGATDVEIHDTVLIAAAFCMFNRYVDGLATTAPDDPGAYAAMAGQIVQHGYLRSEPAVTAPA